MGIESQRTKQLESNGFKFKCGKDVPAILYEASSPAAQKILQLCQEASRVDKLPNPYPFQYYVLTLRLHGTNVHVVFKDFIDHGLLVYSLETQYLDGIHASYLVCQGSAYPWHHKRYDWLLDAIKQKHSPSVDALISL